MGRIHHPRQLSHSLIPRPVFADLDFDCWRSFCDFRSDWVPFNGSLHRQDSKTLAGHPHSFSVIVSCVLYCAYFGSNRQPLCDVWFWLHGWDFERTYSTLYLCLRNQTEYWSSITSRERTYDEWRLAVLFLSKFACDLSARNTAGLRYCFYLCNNLGFSHLCNVHSTEKRK